MNTSGFGLLLNQTIFFRFIFMFLHSSSRFISNYSHLKTISANPSPTCRRFKCAVLHFVVGVGERLRFHALVKVCFSLYVKPMWAIIMEPVGGCVAARCAA